MRLPWQKRERRQVSGFTDLVVASREDAALEGLAKASLTAAVEAAAGTWARAFASASVENAPGDVIEAVSPILLAQIGRDLVRRGECVFAIDMARGGEIMLTPVASWDILGPTADPATWNYRVTDGGPTGTRTRHLPSDGVVHFRYSYDPARPWAGVGPLAWANLSSNLHGRVEIALADDAAGSVAYILPAPSGAQNTEDDDDDDTQLSALLTRLRRLKGRLMVVDSMSGSWGGDQRDAPRQDWAQRRLGPEPDATLATLHEATGQAIISACGVPVALIAGSAEGTSQRESWRRFLHGSVGPVAGMVEHELRLKLDAPGLSLSFDALFASDLSGRARAFSSMVKAGLDIEKAAALAGLMEGGDDE